MDLFINDGYTATKSFEAVPGLYPAFSITYRPALLEERRNYANAASKGGTALSKFEHEAVQKHVLEIDGTPVMKIDVKKIRVNALELILSAIFGYSPEDELADAKNS